MNIELFQSCKIELATAKKDQHMTHQSPKADESPNPNRAPIGEAAAWTFWNNMEYVNSALKDHC